jgi:hypothetical protein
LTANVKAGVSSTIAFVLSCFAGVGAPPSEFAREPSIWLKLEPVMFPALLLGVLLALAAMLTAPFTARISGIACVAAMMASMLGVAVGWGTDAQATPRGLLLPMAFLAIPLLGGADAIRCTSANRPGQSGDASLEKSAG